MIPVYENDKIIAMVEHNTNLDFWDGHNMTCGSTGRHKGLTKLKSGKYVLIKTSQWQGERNYAEVISPAQAIHEILKSNSTELFKVYPDLKDLANKILDEEIHDG